MVFEGLVADLLQEHLGAYLDGLDKKSLSISVWSGDVDLRNVSLKRTALSGLRLPVEVTHGSVGQLQLHVPWRSLGSKPVSVVIRDVLLLAAPSPETKARRSSEPSSSSVPRARAHPHGAPHTPAAATHR